MTRTVDLTSFLAAPPQIVWHYVRKSALLDFVAAPLVRFRPHDRFPEEWTPGEHRAGMWLGGVLPIGWQVIGIEYPESKAPRRILRDNGYGPLITRWDHWIEIEPDGDGTRYTDRVHIDAGLLTLPVAAFARFFYAHRQRRWRKLVAQDFSPLKSY